MRGETSVKLYSLFYVGEKHARNKNLRGGFRNSTDVYLRCGSLLAKSARYHGIEFSIVTNNIEFVRERLEAMGASHVHIIGHRFDLNVPKDIDFYAAHYKLELIQAIGAGAFGARVGLIDIDTVIIRPFPAWVYDADSFLAYEISGQVFPNYGRDRVLHDLQCVAGRSLSTPVWFGGEFLMGTSSAFRRVSSYIDLCWSPYCSNVKALHHSGDEMVISAALAMAREEGEPIEDVGLTDVVSRWWSVHTGFVQKPWHTASRACLIHVPADKTFLAAQSTLAFDPKGFLASYAIHARSKILRRKIFSVVWPPFSKKRRYLASMVEDGAL